MKLHTLAAAIIAASVSVSAQADFSVGGDVGIAYSQDNDGTTSFGGRGSEVTFDASEKVGDLTYFGHFEVNVAGATVNSISAVEGSSEPQTVTQAGQLSSDDMYVGVKGGFGTIKIGDTDNGCDTVDTGWVASDEYISHSSGGCKASDQNNITYSNTSGAVSYAVSYSPDVDNGAAAGAGTDSFAIGIKGKLGVAAISLGYETETSAGSNVVLGVSGNLGPVSLGIRANKAEDNDDALIGYTAQYAAGNNIAYIGIGDTGTDTLFLGYQRKVGANTRLVAEWVDTDGASDDAMVLGFKHNF